MKDNTLILVVEDSSEDWMIMQRAFRQSNLKNRIVRIEDGDAALDYVNHEGAYADPFESPRPGLILLDLNLPGTDGREVLAAIKTNPATSSIPVVVLTTSKDPRDVESCYSLGANSYIAKPVSVERFLTALVKLENYWFEVSVLPKGA